ncbi:MAG TPA: hypothetical protein VF414_02930, partial [Thermoanaerobaculia bacterium]
AVVAQSGERLNKSPAMPAHTFRMTILRMTILLSGFMPSHQINHHPVSCQPNNINISISRNDDIGIAEAYFLLLKRDPTKRGNV